jgi:hypothetical protein
MSKLNAFTVPAMALAVLVTAVPAAASAQAYRPAPPHAAPAYSPAVQAYAARKDAIERRVDRAVQQRRLDIRAAREFKNELISISRQERDFARGGFSRQERAQLDRRLDRLESRVDREIRDDRRGPGRR